LRKQGEAWEKGTGASGSQWLNSIEGKEPGSQGDATCRIQSPAVWSRREESRKLIQDSKWGINSNLFYEFSFLCQIGT
jgi:hypothetical protein